MKMKMKKKKKINWKWELMVIGERGGQQYTMSTRGGVMDESRICTAESVSSQLTLFCVQAKNELL